MKVRSTKDAVLSLSSVQSKLSNVVKFVLAPRLGARFDPYSVFVPVFQYGVVGTQSTLRLSSTPYLAIRRWLPLVGEPNTQLQRIGRSLVLLLFPYTVVPLLFRLQPPDFSILIFYCVDP